MTQTAEKEKLGLIEHLADAETRPLWTLFVQIGMLVAWYLLLYYVPMLAGAMGVACQENAWEILGRHMATGLGMTLLILDALVALGFHIPYADTWRTYLVSKLEGYKKEEEEGKPGGGAKQATDVIKNAFDGWAWDVRVRRTHVLFKAVMPFVMFLMVIDMFGAFGH